MCCCFSQLTTACLTLLKLTCWTSTRSWCLWECPPLHIVFVLFLPDLHCTFELVRGGKLVQLRKRETGRKNIPECNHAAMDSAANKWQLTLYFQERLVALAFSLRVACNACVHAHLIPLHVSDHQTLIWNCDSIVERASEILALSQKKQIRIQGLRIYLKRRLHYASKTLWTPKDSLECCIRSKHLRLREYPRWRSADWCQTLMSRRECLEVKSGTLWKQFR